MSGNVGNTVRPGLGLLRRETELTTAGSLPGGGGGDGVAGPIASV